MRRRGLHDGPLLNKAFILTGNTIKVKMLAGKMMKVE
jgi:hypothetical protein